MYNNQFLVVHGSLCTSGTQNALSKKENRCNKKDTIVQVIKLAIRCVCLLLPFLYPEAQMAKVFATII